MKERSALQREPRAVQEEMLVVFNSSLTQASGTCAVEIMPFQSSVASGSKAWEDTYLLMKGTLLKKKLIIIIIYIYIYRSALV